MTDETTDQRLETLIFTARLLFREIDDELPELARDSAVEDLKSLVRENVGMPRDGNPQKDALLSDMLERGRILVQSIERQRPTARTNEESFERNPAFQQFKEVVEEYPAPMDMSEMRRRI
jgi:hypothetical protein